MDAQVRGWATRLGRIKRRLEESEGRRVARRHAREELDSLLRSIRNALHKEFPNFSKDGEAVIHEIPLPAGLKSCGLCKAYCGTFRKLAEHLLDNHGERCPCGYVPKAIDTAIKSGNRAYHLGKQTWKASKWGSSQMTGHLRAVKEDLKTHVLVGAIGSQPIANSV